MRTSQNAVLVDAEFIFDNSIDYKSKLIYLILLSKTDKYGTTASLTELSRLSGFCINTVMRILSDLSRLHIIQKLDTPPGEQTVFDVIRQTPAKKFCIKVDLSILYNVTIKPLCKMLYTTLTVYKHMGYTKDCYPGYKTLAACLGVSKRTVQRASTLLQKVKAIAVELIRDEGKYPYLKYDVRESSEFVNDDEIAKPKERSLFQKRMHDLLNFNKDKKKGRVGTTNSVTAKAKDFLFIQSLDTDNSNTYNPECQVPRTNFTNLDIKSQIGYDALVQNHRPARALIDSMIIIITEEYRKTDAATISGVLYTREEIIAKLQQLTSDHIELAIERYQNHTQKIANPKAYMRSILLNTLSDIDLDVTNQVMYDMYHPQDE